MHSASVVVVLSGFLLLATTLLANETDPQSKIVEGTPVPITVFPYQVSMQSDDGKHFCGASIISNEFVLSAAHCCWGSHSSEIQLTVGSSDYTSGERYHVTKIVGHPKYSYHKIADYDVCVIKVARPFVLSARVAIIPLAAADTTVPNGTLVGASGWGAQVAANKGTQSVSPVLLAIIVPYLDHKTCYSMYSGHISDRMICTFDPKSRKGTCQGDSGGPLVAVVNGKPVLIGVTSWGFECGPENFPSVYASVANLRSWITETMATM